MRPERILKTILDMIYPPICPICNRIAPRSGICLQCESKVSLIKGPVCAKCGKSVDEGDKLCRDCKKGKHLYDEGCAAFEYDEYMSASIYRFKYNGKREFAAWYGRAMAKNLGPKIRSYAPKVIIPVPIHKSRLKKRGYNQAALIAKELSKHVGIPVREDLSKRTVATKVQKDLGAASRQNNLKKAFIVTPNVVKYETVLIVDDIYTTGSTIDALAGALKAAGVKKVYFATLCIGTGD